MKSVLVIGMGRFGIHLARRMQELKNDVMVVDRNPNIADELTPIFSDVQIGDCTRETVLRSFGVSNFDICFVTIGENFQSSLEITSLLKDMGAKYVIAKANREIQGKFLLRNGADEVIYPEKEMAEHLALRLNSNNVFDFIELTPEFAIFELPVMSSWAGKSIASINVRRKYNVNIIAIKGANKRISTMPEPDYIFKEDDHIIAAGRQADLMKMSNKIKD
ncbi:MAG: TrkA family potassium uptake protein [Clostridia bacterium]|nr:TrkA family potassium uptake protein [Clostridia bacterium]